MAIPKKGSRKIVVDGVEYRWRVRWKPSYSQAIGETNLTAAIELYENPQSILSITFPWVRYDAWIGAAEHPITPKLIENCVLNALVQGWKPDQKDKAFKIQHKNQ